jgi:hypothetical protein
VHTVCTLSAVTKACKPVPAGQKLYVFSTRYYKKKGTCLYCSIFILHSTPLHSTSPLTVRGMHYSNIEGVNLRMYYMLRGNTMKEGNTPSFKIFLSIITNLTSCYLHSRLFSSKMQFKST